MKHLTIALVLLLSSTVFSQQPLKIYNPAADSKKDLTEAIQTAKEQNKHVLIQVGGNWCSWCLKLHSFFETESQIDSILKADFIFLLVNYSPENKNEALLAGLGYPQRFGFPVLLVLDQNGQRLHTQDTGYLELGKGYNNEKITRFLLAWNRSAVDPTSYNK